MAKLVGDCSGLITWLEGGHLQSSDDWQAEADLIDYLVDTVREFQFSQVETVDGERKYVSLARYGDEVRDGWRGNPKVEHTFLESKKSFLTPGTWQLDGDLFQYRVPVDLIDEQTGMPKARATIRIEGTPSGKDVCVRIVNRGTLILFEVYNDRLHVDRTCDTFKAWKEAGFQVDVDTCHYVTNSGDRLAISVTSDGTVWVGNHNLSTPIPVYDLRNLRPIYDKNHALLPFMKDAAGNLMFIER